MTAYIIKMTTKKEMLKAWVTRKPLQKKFLQISPIFPFHGIVYISPVRIKKKYLSSIFCSIGGLNLSMHVYNLALCSKFNERRKELNEKGERGKKGEKKMK
jgi:hypothetical protein